jgi:hypothetical protein
MAWPILTTRRVNPVCTLGSRPAAALLHLIGELGAPFRDAIALDPLIDAVSGLASNSLAALNCDLHANDIIAKAFCIFCGPSGARFAVTVAPRGARPYASRTSVDSQQLWGNVVDKFVALDTQFKNDVFWRVREVREASQTGRPGVSLPLRDRGTNERVHTSRWHRDYRLYETDRYEIFVETHSPDAHGNQVPGDATIAMTSSDDEEALIRLSALPLPIVPNETSSQRFSVDTNNVLDRRYSGIRLETQVPNHTSAYPAGSLCNLIEIAKKLDPIDALVINWMSEHGGQVENKNNAASGLGISRDEIDGKRPLTAALSFG